MTLMGLARGSLANRLPAVSLTVLTIAISIGLLVLVEQMRGQVRDGFYRSVSGTDLIVGAPTAPIQLLLYSVFGLGNATNNVTWASYQDLAARPTVDWTIPISLGDAHAGYRVIGTTDAMLEHYRYAGRQALEVAEGVWFEDLYDVVLGARVARQLGYSIGDEIVLAHGGGNVSLQQHDDQPFTVSGILAPTGTPVDQSLYISLQAHTAIHIGWETGRVRPGALLTPDEARAQADALTPDEITAFFVGLNNRAAVFGLQFEINQRYDAEALLAVLPGIALQELWRITGLAERILRIVAGLVVLAGLLGMLTALLTTLNERRREMAILRACGARPWQIASLLLLEAGVITASGIALGLLLATITQIGLAPWLLSRFGVAVTLAWPAAWQWAVLAAIWAAGVLIALVPAAMVYRRTLADGMQVRQ
jgi:putative ABC transport system permease protein